MNQAGGRAAVGEEAGKDCQTEAQELNVPAYIVGSRRSRRVTLLVVCLLFHACCRDVLDAEATGKQDIRGYWLPLVRRTWKAGNTNRTDATARSPQFCAAGQNAERDGSLRGANFKYSFEC
ncbi:MAG: hypothetical protein IH899_06545 [Planctomycetes bacterium]|nr:hypothetical protein [Planctomycetota bacterium]